jgi:hypothetical protein
MSRWLSAVILRHFMVIMQALSPYKHYAVYYKQPLYKSTALCHDLEKDVQKKSVENINESLTRVLFFFVAVFL